MPEISQVTLLKAPTFKFGYHVDAFYNFETHKWLQKSKNDILPENNWFNLTWKMPKYPIMCDTIIITGK